MKPITQRRDDDCLAACIAMVTGRELDDVPYIPTQGRSDDFWGEWIDWAASEGYVLRFSSSVYLCDPRGKAMPYELPTEGRWIAVVPSKQRGPMTHAVVMDGERLWHDPARWNPRTRKPRKILFGLRVDRGATL